jgi:DNA-binding winged helix-turn-helix (wHTH) protein
MAARVTFAGFVLDSPAFTLTGPAGTISLERLPMELLLLLARCPGTLVTREEIRLALWGPDLHIEHDAAINTAVRKVRQALGDDPAHPRFVQTVVGKGYRFAANLRVEGPHLRFTVTFRSREILLVHGDTLIGRDPDAQIWIDDPSVSRRHAIISVSANGAVLRDLGSRNGTFVDGRRIEAPTPLVDGAVVSIGPVALPFAARTAPTSTVTAELAP